MANYKIYETSLHGRREINRFVGNASGLPEPADCNMGELVEALENVDSFEIDDLPVFGAMIINKNAVRVGYNKDPEGYDMQFQTLYTFIQY